MNEATFGYDDDVFDGEDISDRVGAEDVRPEMCRNCDYDCDEPDESGCPLMGL